MAEWRYKIEIWQWHTLVDICRDNEIEAILEWFRDEGWRACYDYDNCTFYVYDNNRELSFEELKH